MAVSVERLKEALNYDPATGAFTWKISIYRTIKAGSVAGCKTRGRIVIRLDGKLFLAHRAAWAIMTGEWPTLQIDHKDCCPYNNAWDNLRLATNSQNQANKRRQRNNTSGYKGVSWFKPAKRWMAQTKVMNKKIHIGYFSTAEEAHEAYRRFFVKEFGEFARTA